MSAHRKVARETARFLRERGATQVSVVHDTHHPLLTFVVGGRRYEKYIRGTPNNAENYIRTLRRELTALAHLEAPR